MQKLLISVALLLSISFSSIAQQPELFSVSGKAIKGYDPVAYFTKGKAVQGDPKIVYTWRGSNWYFSSAEHLKAFQENPEKYSPQYGGYCAYGMADGHKAPTDNEAWTILNGKLYLNYNLDVQKMWKEKQAEYIITADKNWPELKSK